MSEQRIRVSWRQWLVTLELNFNHRPQEYEVVESFLTSFLVYSDNELIKGLFKDFVNEGHR